MDAARFADQVSYLCGAGINGFVVFDLSQRFARLMDEVSSALDSTLNSATSLDPKPKGK